MSQDLKLFLNTVINVIVTQNAKDKATNYQVKKKLDKQVEFLKVNTKHPSLKFEPVESMKGVWRFRLDKHFWALAMKEPNRVNTLRVFDVIKHL